MSYFAVSNINVSWEQTKSLSVMISCLAYMGLSYFKPRNTDSCWYLKGKFPQTTMWIEWVEGNFTNPTVKVWADLDKPFKRIEYAKLCMSPSLDETLPECVISQEDNSPLTLYIDFHKF